MLNKSISYCTALFFFSFLLSTTGLVVRTAKIMRLSMVHVEEKSGSTENSIRGRWGCGKCHRPPISPPVCSGLFLCLLTALGL